VAKLPLAVGAIVGLGATAVLVGWALDVRELQALYVSSVTIKSNTAAALLLAAVALIAASRAPQTSAASTGSSLWVRLPAFVVFLTGALTVAQYAGGFSLGIDEILFRVPEDAALTPFPGRMASISALALAALGAGLMLMDYQPRAGVRLSEIFLVGCGTLALAALLGYGYGAIPRVGLGQGLQIAIPTAIFLVLLVMGALSLGTQGGFMATFVGDDAGGVLARRLLPFAFGVPFILGALRAMSSLTTMSVAMQAAMPSVLAMLAFAGVIWRTAQVVSASDRERQAAERELKTLSGLLPICSYCKKVRNETNYWQQVDTYLTTHAGVELTHSICPDCSDKMIRELDAAPV